MSDPALAVYNEAMTLPKEERSQLAWALLDSTRTFDDDEDDADVDVEAEWDGEIAKRIAEIDSGKIPLKDAFEDLREIRALIK